MSIRYLEGNTKFISNLYYTKKIMVSLKQSKKKIKNKNHTLDNDLPIYK